MIQTSRTYISSASAQLALEKALARINRNLDNTRWLIAVAPDGRFAPVVIASSGPDQASLIPLIHVGITVVG